jgi:hypothetical protein
MILLCENTQQNAGLCWNLENSASILYSPSKTCCDDKLLAALLMVIGMDWLYLRKNERSGGHSVATTTSSRHNLSQTPIYRKKLQSTGRLLNELAESGSRSAIILKLGKGFLCRFQLRELYLLIVES